MIAASSTVDEAAAVSPTLDVRPVAGYDEIAIRAARPRTTGWLILHLIIQIFVGATTIFVAVQRHAFVALFVGSWVIILSLLALCLVWMVVGVKRIAVINGNLWVGSKFFRWTLSRAYRGSQIRGFEASHKGDVPRRRRQRRPGIRFLYGTRSVHIGFDLEESDIDRLVELLAARLSTQALDWALRQ